jgi:hypothetical protein
MSWAFMFVIWIQILPPAVPPGQLTYGVREIHESMHFVNRADCEKAAEWIPWEKQLKVIQGVAVITDNGLPPPQGSACFQVNS